MSKTQVKPRSQETKKNQRNPDIKDDDIQKQNLIATAKDSTYEILDMCEMDLWSRLGQVIDVGLCVKYKRITSCILEPAHAYKGT